MHMWNQETLGKGSAAWGTEVWALDSDRDRWLPAGSGLGVGLQLLPLCHSNPHHLLVCNRVSEQSRVGSSRIYLDLDLWVT